MIFSLTQMKLILLPNINFFGFEFEEIISGGNALAIIYIYINTTKVDCHWVNNLSEVQKIE